MIYLILKIAYLYEIDSQKAIDEKHLSTVLESAGVKADSAKVKALVASLKDVNIDEAVKQAVVAPIAAAPRPNKPLVKALLLLTCEL
jgi:large subunit ribosomal protein L12